MSWVVSAIYVSVLAFALWQHWNCAPGGCSYGFVIGWRLTLCCVHGTVARVLQSMRPPCQWIARCCLRRRWWTGRSAVLQWKSCQLMNAWENMPRLVALSSPSYEDMRMHVLQVFVCCLFTPNKRMIQCARCVFPFCACLQIHHRNLATRPFRMKRVDAAMEAWLRIYG